ncbi:MAG: hypothetical protein Kow00117_18810 [Phototrophicales bacterium]
MGIEVMWDQENIIRWECVETWDIGDFYMAVSHTCQMMDTSKNHIDLIISFVGQRMPVNLISHLGKLQPRFPQDTLIVVIESNRLVSSIVNITRRVFGESVLEGAPTLQAARARILAHQDELRDRTRPLRA